MSQVLEAAYKGTLSEMTNPQLHSFFSVRMLGMLSLLASANMLNGCATTSEPTPPLLFQCDRGTTLNVQLRTVDVSVMRGGRNAFPRVEKRTTGANVTLTDGTALELTAQKVASGFKVSDGHHTLWSKGNVASWTVGRTSIEQCQLQR